jgi:hypothetical protein
MRGVPVGFEVDVPVRVHVGRWDGKVDGLLTVYGLFVCTCIINLEWIYNDYLCCRQGDGALGIRLVL